MPFNGIPFEPWDYEVDISAVYPAWHSFATALPVRWLTIFEGRRWMIHIERTWMAYSVLSSAEPSELVKISHAPLDWSTIPSRDKAWTEVVCIPLTPDQDRDTVVDRIMRGFGNHIVEGVL